MDINVELLDPNGDPLPVESVTVTEQINQGWTWSATLADVPHTYTVDGVPGKSLLDAFLEDACFTLTLTAGGHTLNLPPLVVQDYQESVSGGGTLSGIDLVMYRLTRSTHSMAPVMGTTSANVLSAIAADLDLTGKMLDFSSWSFPIHEVESTGRTNMLVHVQRICDVAGYEFRCIRYLGAEGLQFYPLEFAPGDPPATQPDWSSVSRQRAFSDRITSLSFVKTSRMSTQEMVQHGVAGSSVALGSTYTDVQCTDSGVELWDGDPAGGGVQRSVRGVSVGNGNVTHIKFAGFHHTFSTFYVLGSTGASAGTQLAFCVNHDSGISPARPADEAWEEQWFPTQTYVEDRAELYLWMRNRHTHTLSWEGPPCLWLGLGYTLTWPGEPDSRVESITHTLGSGQASTSVTSAVTGTGAW